jgi:hypothetical protein
MWSGVEAEQALLGAVLADPAGQQAVLDLVEPGDMRRPWHGQVLAAMQRLRGSGALPSPARVYRELQRDPDLPRSVALDAVPLAGLIEASPRPAHAGVYAAIVAEAGIRRRVQLAASRIVQAAEAGDLDAALGQAARARADLAACAARWAALPARLRGEPASPPAAALWPDRRPATGQETARPDGDPRFSQNAAWTARALSVAGQTPAAPAPAGSFPARQPASDADSSRRSADPAAREAAAVALRDLIDDPSQLTAVTGWLRPEHFPDAASGRLYAVLLDMHAAGQPVDPVTVAWAAARRGLRTDPARLAGGTGPFAVASAREVRRVGVLAQITGAGIAIQGEAADPGTTPFRLIQAAVLRLQPFQDEPLPQHDLPGGAAALCAAARQPAPEAAR